MRWKLRPNRLAPAALCACAVALVLSGTASGAATIVVTSTADSGANSLRAALAAAAPGDTISIPNPGTYQVTSAALAVTTNVSIVGSGPGVKITGDGNNGVFNVTASSVTISDLTITGGGITGPSAAGGGIANAAGTLSLQRVTVENNMVTNTSGGVPQGGGVANATGTLRITDSTISGNSASTAGGGGVPEGAGLWNASGNVTLTRTQLTGNTNSIGGGGGVPEGGGVDTHGGALNVVDSSISDNKALGGAIPQGVGIYALMANVTISGSTISGNTGSVSGAGTIANGGGIDQVKGSLTLVNSTIANNTLTSGSGSEGGGIQLFDATLDATNVTIAGNSAAGPSSIGGNLQLTHSSLPTVFRPRNTIVTGGIAPSSANCLIEPGTSTVSQGHNLESANECGFSAAAGDIVNSDPKLGDLADNGGPTQTLAPAVDSPAIDAGTNTGCPATDQRGVARPQVGICDIGAFERVFSADMSMAVLSAPATAPVGLPFTVKLGLSEFGPDPDIGVVAGDLLPPKARLVSANPSQGSCDLAAASCNLGALGITASAQVTLVVLPTKPGTLKHDFRVSAKRPDATAGNDVAPLSVKVTPLALTRFSSLHKKFRLGKKKPRLTRRKPVGTSLRFRLSAPARVTFAFAKASKGKRGHVRYKSAGKLTVSGKAGANKLLFQGPLSRRKKLRPGTYRVTATGKDRFGNKSKPRRLTLRILRA